ncbi:pirin family protein [Paludisphaera sp.]|uniref:pirin family protein n=1 Tax=Paludisphaera sp. TaxID=2017432 RepID=UPI00301D620E
MMTIRRASDRGGADHGWLKTAHTFSFGSYHDPDHMGFRDLRVVNEDVVRPGSGFGRHGHRDMEIISYVLEGALEHRDSMDNVSVLGPGEVQAMSAGRGIMHGERNASTTEPVHFYQIWILPDRPGLEPRYDQKAFPTADRRDAWRLAASPDGREGSLKIHQDAAMYLASLDAGAELARDIAPGRHAWLQVLRGRVVANGEALEASDGAALSDEPAVSIRAEGPAEIMLFDLA